MTSTRSPNRSPSVSSRRDEPLDKARVGVSNLDERGPDADDQVIVFRAYPPDDLARRGDRPCRAVSRVRIRERKARFEARAARERVGGLDENPPAREVLEPERH